MRVISALAGLAALAFAHGAAAAPVTVSPVSVSSEFQVKLDEELGAREGETLRRYASEAVAAALSRAGVGASATVSIDIVLIDAAPNRPTMEQLADRPGLSLFGSVSVGGAELTAMLRGADGAVLAEVAHRYYTPSLAYVFESPDTWTDARRAIRQFARKVAEAAAGPATP